MNKVKYGLSNLHVGDVTESPTAEPVFGEQKAFPGSVSMSLDAEGDTNAFKADNGDYWIAQANNGYTGEWEVAMIPDWFKLKYLGYVEDEDGSLIESATPNFKPFYAQYQFEGDEKAIKHTLYKIVAGRPSEEASTVEDSIEPQTDTLPITVTPIAYNGKNYVKKKSSDNTSKEAYDNWFSTAPTFPKEKVETEPEAQG